MGPHSTTSTIIVSRCQHISPKQWSQKVGAYKLFRFIVLGQISECKS